MKPEITKEKFEDYLYCQEIGYWNMFDYNSYKDNDITSLTKEEWKEIIKNYSFYKKKFA